MFGWAWPAARSIVRRPLHLRRRLATDRFGSVGRILKQGLDLDDTYLEYLFARHPGLAELSAERVLASLAFLHERARVPRASSLAAVLRAAPELLLADVEAQLMPNLAALHILLSKEAVTELLCGAPSVLLREPSELQKLERVFTSLRLRLEDVLRRAPMVGLCEASHIQTLCELLRDPDRGGMDEEALATTILLQPRVLLRSEQELAELVRFVREDLDTAPASPTFASLYATGDASKLKRILEVMRQRGFSTEEIRSNADLLNQE